MVAEILRLVAMGELFTQGQEQIGVARLDNTAAEMHAAPGAALLPENHGQVGEPWRAFIDQLRARERGTAAAGDRLSEAEIDCAVLRVAAVQRHVE
jgi:heme oxygenase